MVFEFEQRDDEIFESISLSKRDLQTKLLKLESEMMKIYQLDVCILKDLAEKICFLKKQLSSTKPYMDYYSINQEISEIKNMIENIKKISKKTTYNNAFSVFNEFETVSKQRKNVSEDVKNDSSKYHLIFDPLILLDPNGYYIIHELNSEGIFKSEDVLFVIPDVLKNIYLDVKMIHLFPLEESLWKMEERFINLCDNLVKLLNEFNRNKKISEIKELQIEVKQLSVDRKLMQELNEDKGINLLKHVNNINNFIRSIIVLLNCCIRIHETLTKNNYVSENRPNYVKDIESEIREIFYRLLEYVFRIIRKNSWVFVQKNILLLGNLILYDKSEIIDVKEIEVISNLINLEQNNSNNKPNCHNYFQNVKLLESFPSIYKMLRILVNLMYAQNLYKEHLPKEKIIFLSTSDSITELYQKCYAYLRDFKKSLFITLKKWFPRLGAALIDLETKVEIRHFTQNYEPKILVTLGNLQKFYKILKAFVNTSEVPFKLPSSAVFTASTKMVHFIIEINNRNKIINDAKHCLSRIKWYKSKNWPLVIHRDPFTTFKTRLSIKEMDVLIKNENLFSHVFFAIYEATNDPMCFDPWNERYSVLRILLKRFDPKHYPNIDKNFIELVYKIMRDPYLFRNGPYLKPAFQKALINNSG